MRQGFRFLDRPWIIKIIVTTSLVDYSFDNSVQCLDFSTGYTMLAVCERPSLALSNPFANRFNSVISVSFVSSIHLFRNLLAQALYLYDAPENRVVGHKADCLEIRSG